MSSHADQDHLDRLYQDQPPIEPPAGLDRMIRAQAEQAVEQDRAIKSLPWTGGVATAAVLVLAVAVVIQVPEPAPEVPMPETTTAPPDALMRQEESAPQAAPELDRVKVTGSRARSAEAASAFSDRPQAEPDPPPRQTIGRSASDPADDQTIDSAESARLEQRSAPLVEAEGVSERLAVSDPSPWLALEEAIGAGDAELARSLFERLLEAFPEDERLDAYRERILQIESGE